MDFITSLSDNCSDKPSIPPLGQSMVWLIPIILFLGVGGGLAQERGFGIGVILGEPMGGSAKFWTNDKNAIDVGIGWSIGGDRFFSGKQKPYSNGSPRVHYHADYLTHSASTSTSANRS